MTYVPEQGHLVWLTFDPQAGHEQSGRRPAVVLTPASYNRKTGLIVACPVTSKVKAYPFEVSLPAGLPIAGVVLADQAKSADWRARQATCICELPSDVLLHILAKLSALLAAT